MVSDAELSLAAELIRQGRLVAFPTETVYGLGANALDARAVQRIYDAKGRPSTSPLIVHAADVEMVRSVVSEWPEAASRLAARFWPGPLTLIIRKNDAVPGIVTAGLDSVGVRIPAHPVALGLIRRAGVPIAAPSANRFMQISPTTAEHVRTGLGDRVDLVLDGGPTRIGIESTVVSLTGTTAVVLRPGMITEAEIGEVIAVGQRPPDTAISESPGLHPRHYAPRTPFYLLNSTDPLPQGRGRILEMPAAPAEFAAQLYAQLHRADQEAWDWIAIRNPPDNAAWNAIRDRLTRAATRV